jgi:hypothetical protein
LTLAYLTPPKNAPHSQKKVGKAGRNLQIPSASEEYTFLSTIFEKLKPEKEERTIVLTSLDQAHIKLFQCCGHLVEKVNHHNTIVEIIGIMPHLSPKWLNFYIFKITT